MTFLEKYKFTGREMLRKTFFGNTQIDEKYLCRQTEPLIEVASQLSSRLSFSSSTTWAGWIAMELLEGESAVAVAW